MIPYQTSKEIEKAITFLVQAITTSGNNPKPVILHSILVGLSLAKFNYPLHIIQAGFLHETTEDSNTSIKSIKEQFGDKVATIVAARTHDHPIQNKAEQYKDAMRRAAETGKDSLIVMAPISSKTNLITTKKILRNTRGIRSHILLNLLGQF